MKRNKYEQQLEDKCCIIARGKGLAAVKLEKNGHKGVPDRLFIQQGGKCMFVEFKTPTGHGVKSGEQLFWSTFLDDAHAFIDNEADFVKVISLRFGL